MKASIFYHDRLEEWVYWFTTLSLHYRWSSVSDFVNIDQILLQCSSSFELDHLIVKDFIVSSESNVLDIEHLIDRITFSDLYESHQRSLFWDQENNSWKNLIQLEKNWREAFKKEFQKRCWIELSMKQVNTELINERVENQRLKKNLDEYWDIKMIQRPMKLDAMKKWQEKTLYELKILNQELKISKQELKIFDQKLKKVEERWARFVQCSICYEFSSNVRIVCNHIFCKSCINRLEHNSGENFRCSMCRMNLRGCSGGVLYNLDM